MKKRLLLIMFSLSGLLSACGGSDGIDMTAATASGMQQGGAPPSTEAPASWINEVLSVIGMSSETTEPVAIGDIAAERPDKAEPSPAS